MGTEAGRCVVAIDAGTTGVRSRAVFAGGGDTAAAYHEFAQIYPRPGWVEHDAEEIWAVARATLNDVVAQVGRDAVAAIGIANQRETAVAWNRRTGKPYGTAIVWQDRRTADRCEALRERGYLPQVRDTTGLVLDPYFTASKFEWLLAERNIPIDAELALGTIDSWLIWNLTAGEVHATDVTNASRTMLFDIRSLQWSTDLCELFGVPMSALPAVLPSSGRFGSTSERSGCPVGIPIAGVAGDQQAALFGQACFESGMAKNTYGTGSFVLLNVGAACPPPTEGMLTTVAWKLADGTVAYALEGAIFITGAAIQWLRDGLGLINSSADIGPLAESTADNGGVYVVPAFTGLGSPWWDPYARGTIVGITRGTTKAHLARAVVEAMAYQTRDVVEAMSTASGTTLEALRVDGGASVMDVLLQMQADQLGVTVQRPRDQETTALGAAFLAGLAEGVWPSLQAITERWEIDATFQPGSDRTFTDLAYTEWTRAVGRSRVDRSSMNRGTVIVAGSLAALLVATAASALGEIDGATAGAPATRGTSVQATPTVPPPVPRVLWIGDSSLEGLKFYTPSQRAIGGMTYVLDAESCRRLVRPSCHSLAGKVPNTALEAIQGSDGAFDAVVVGTGYNEGSSQFSSDFDQIVAAARARGAVRILWMNYRLRDGLTRAGTDNNGSYVNNNATLLKKVASGAYPDVYIADWRDYSAPVRDWFVSDGIHYMPTGALGAADYISRWITALFDEPCPQPMTVGGPIANPCTPPDGSPPPDLHALYG